MHGFEHSNKFSRILSIDLGKFNSVACIYDPATTAHSFVTIQTTLRPFTSAEGCGSLKRTGLTGHGRPGEEICEEKNLKRSRLTRERLHSRLVMQQPIGGEH